ncbi:MAG: hypothetical protein H0T78_02980, partial [Longispora sp.]|nr:hypothetical protein [Longispora sp. (in: high G+C Gram-positive bacteria)]
MDLLPALDGVYGDRRDAVMIAGEAVSWAAGSYTPGAPHDDLGQEIVAFVVASDVTDRELTDFGARELSVHKRPRRVVFVA